jgi:hypothetical protein
MNTQQPKKKPIIYANDNVLESLRDVGAGVAKTVASDVVAQSATDALSALFGGPIPRQGEQPREQQVGGEALTPQIHRQEVRPSMPMVKAEEQGIKEQIEAVRAELKALAASIKNLNQDIQKAVVEVPVDPGIYHLNFFDRLRTILKLMREQIDDSRAWLGMSANRKKKMGYWGMFKKHGTTFGLSHERNLATQAG